MHGLKAIVTAGPTYEPIDPVRFIGNRSSGKQGYAIALALAKAGADVTLISGPVSFEAATINKNENQTKEGTLRLQEVLNYVKYIPVQTAAEMIAACENALPAEIAICAAAVSDWAPVYFPQKIKKSGTPPTIIMKENPDILKTLANHKQRPKLVIGFAAETLNLLENARKKLKSKNCDWILANDVHQNPFGADDNQIHLITRETEEEWPRMSKTEIAEKLRAHILKSLAS